MVVHTPFSSQGKTRLYYKLGIEAIILVDEIRFICRDHRMKDRHTEKKKEDEKEEMICWTYAA